MSLLLNGSKTAVIAGSELQLIEIYQGEAYTFPFTFKDSAGYPVDITSWTFDVSAKWYRGVITYPSQATTVDVTVSDLELISPQPSGLVLFEAIVTDGPNGLGYLYIPDGLENGETVGLNDITSLIVIVTMTVTRTDALSSQPDISKEPIGMIVRYL